MAQTDAGSPARAFGLLSKVASPEDTHFAIETLKNLFWFCVIGLAALGLQNFVVWIEANNGSKGLVALLTIAEYCALVADLIWFISRLVADSTKAIFRAVADIKRYKGQIALKSISPS
jgi:hypothetical protein